MQKMVKRERCALDEAVIISSSVCYRHQAQFGIRIQGPPTTPYLCVYYCCFVLFLLFPSGQGVLAPLPSNVCNNKRMASCIVLKLHRLPLVLTPAFPSCSIILTTDVRRSTIIAIVLLHFTGRDPRSHDLLKDQYVWSAGFNLDLGLLPQLANLCPVIANKYLSLSFLFQLSFSLLFPQSHPLFIANIAQGVGQNFLA